MLYNIAPHGHSWHTLPSNPIWRHNCWRLNFLSRICLRDQTRWWWWSCYRSCSCRNGWPSWHSTCQGSAHKVRTEQASPSALQLYNRTAGSWCKWSFPEMKNSFWILKYVFFWKKWANPGLFFVYFRSFQTNNTIFIANICEKCPSSIWCQDLNPWPSEREPLPITTRPGLPSYLFNFVYT